MRPDLYQKIHKLEKDYWWYVSRRELIKQLLPQKPNLKILDIGCGAGKLLEELKSYGQVYGIDSSSQAVKFCKQRGLKHIYINKFPQVPKSILKKKFDVITCLDVIEHIEDDTKAIKTITNLLVPGGRLILTVPAYPWLFSYWDTMSGHYRRYSQHQLLNLINKSKLALTKITYLYSFLIPIAIPFRVIRHQFFKHKPPPSDLIKLHPLINKFLFSLAIIEQRIRSHVKLPFGLSLLCIAEKTNKHVTKSKK